MLCKSLLQVAVCKGTGGSWQLHQNALRSIKEDNPSRKALPFDERERSQTNLSVLYLPAAIPALCCHRRAERGCVVCCHVSSSAPNTSGPSAFQITRHPTKRKKAWPSFFLPNKPAFPRLSSSVERRCIFTVGWSPGTFNLNVEMVSSSGVTLLSKGNNSKRTKWEDVLVALCDCPPALGSVAQRIKGYVVPPSTF